MNIEQTLAIFQRGSNEILPLESVLMPISAPSPYSKPSAKAVEALTIIEEESTSLIKRRPEV
jgi:hypothetical protein